MSNESKIDVDALLAATGNYNADAVDESPPAALMHGKSHPYSKFLWPIFVFLILQLLTVFVSLHLHDQHQINSQTKFSAHADDLALAIRNRMSAHEQILLGVAGLYSASVEVSRQEFRAYVDALDLAQKFPAILSVGYSKIIQPSELTEHVNAVRAEGFSEYRLHPEGARTLYSAIVYLEPFMGSNLAAFGFDMYSEPIRRKAMAQAVVANHVAMSGKVILVQASGDAQHAGVLMYKPIYKKNLPLHTESQRWAALDGFVYSPYRLSDLMEGLLKNSHILTDFTIYAGSATHSTQLMFASNPAARPPLFSTAFLMDLYGEQWTLVVSSSAQMEQSFKSKVALAVLLLGTIASIFMGYFVWLLVNQRENALSLAGIMTKNIREKNIALKMSDVRFRLALESSAIGTWTWHLSSNDIDWDVSMYKLFGLNGTALNTYESFLAILHPEDRQYVFEEMAYAIERKAFLDIEYRIITADGNVQYIASRAKIIVDETDENYLMAGTCWDISERKRIDKIKEEFVSTVSHELRTPLTSIVGVIGLLLSGKLGDFTDKSRSMLEIANRNALRLKVLINDLLDMEKIIAGKMEITLQRQPLLALVDRVVAENRPYADALNVDLNVRKMLPAEFDAERLEIYVDPLRFIQILTNFISNATKFSPPDGEVVICVELVDNKVRVSVIDKGPGIPLDAQPYIFEKFYQVDSSSTRKKGGTGLGLAIAKELTEKMKGVVGFSSVPNHGSCFYVEFIFIKENLVQAHDVV